jgi:hypothetical protein
MPSGDWENGHKDEVVEQIAQYYGCEGFQESLPHNGFDTAEGRNVLSKSGIGLCFCWPPVVLYHLSECSN